MPQFFQLGQKRGAGLQSPTGTEAYISKNILTRFITGELLIFWSARAWQVTAFAPLLRLYAFGRRASLPAGYRFAKG